MAYNENDDIAGKLSELKSNQISYKNDLNRLSKQLTTIDTDINAIKSLIQSGANSSRLDFEDKRNSSKDKFKEVQDKWTPPQKEQKRQTNDRNKQFDKTTEEVWSAIRDSLGLDKIKPKAGNSKLGKYLDAFEEEFIGNLFDVGGFKSRINNSLEKYADDLGIAVDDIPKAIANGMANTIKQSKFGGALHDKLDNVLSGVVDGLGKIGGSYIDSIKDKIDIEKFRKDANKSKESAQSETGKAAREKYLKKDGDSGESVGSKIIDTVFGKKDDSPKVQISNMQEFANIISANDLFAYILNPEEIAHEVGDEFESAKEASKADAFEDNDVDKDLEATIEDLKERLYSSDNVDDLEQVRSEIQALSENLNTFGDSGASIGALNDASSSLDTMYDDSSSILDDMLNGITEDGLGGTFKSASESAKAFGSDVEGAGGTISNLMGGMGDIFSTALGPIMGPLAAFAAVLGPINIVLELIKPVLEALSAVLGAIMGAANREEETRKKRQEYAQKRLQADVEAMVKAPFDILKDAANALYNTWQDAIGTINATQGYTKADLQDLMSSYAQRIRDEGLEKAVDVSMWTKNLTNVLEKGLTGTIGEEFAFIATKLNAAIPTQDFFSYAESYASLIANAQAAGVSQADAIKQANEAMEQMASNLLYAGREISGGITLGLQSSADLFSDAVKIAQAGRSADNVTLSKLTGTLTSASAIIGAIAPDLSSSIVDAITSAATGGNSDTIVALRSLSNQNASNTEFLKKFIEDPQNIFSSIFNNLANMFNESEDAYMEKAEAYASLFGMSAEAFQRVDFNLLATAINNMNVNNAALEDNLKLIEEGQTTTSSEQLKMQQINQYMIEEGLAYVIDNDVAQMIQQHMWDEQMQRELQETTYGIELTGKSFSLLDAIVGFVEKIANLLNPFYWAKKIANVIQSGQETAAWEADIADMLEAVKIGEGNAEDKRMLTTRNETFSLIGSNGDNKYLTALYDAGFADTTSHVTSVTQAYAQAFNGLTFRVSDLTDAVKANTMASGRNTSATSNNSASLYKWHMVTKSEAKAAANALTKGASESANALTKAGNATAEALAKQLEEKKQIEAFVNDFEKRYVDRSSTKDKIGTVFNTVFGSWFDAIFDQKKDIPKAAQMAAAEVSADTRKSFKTFYDEFKENNDDFDAESDLLWVQPDEDKDYTVYKANTLLNFAKDRTKTFEDWEATMLSAQGWDSDLLEKGDKIKDKKSYQDREMIGRMAEAFEDIATNQYNMNLDQYREYFETERSNAEVDEQRMIEQEEKLARESAIYFYESTHADLGELIELFIINNSILNTIAGLIVDFKSIFTEYKLRWQSYYLGDMTSVIPYSSMAKIGEATELVDGMVAEELDNANAKLLKDFTDAEKSLTGFTAYEKRLNAGLKEGDSYYKKIQEVQSKEKDESDDSIIALADALTANTVDLRDPQVQGNALLAEILKLVAAIVNQTNTTVSNTILSDALGAMATNQAESTVNTVTSTSSAVAATAAVTAVTV